MAINSDVRIQYANNINKNIFGLKTANDNEDSQQALKLISTNLSLLTTTSSRIQSIIKNQVLLSRFEYKEKARIQKEINSETFNASPIADIVSENNSNITPSLIGMFSNMFDDLAQRVQNLAESASTACGGSGLLSGAGMGTGGGRSGNQGGGIFSGIASTAGDLAAAALPFGAIGMAESEYNAGAPSAPPKASSPTPPVASPTVAAAAPAIVTAPTRKEEPKPKSRETAQAKKAAKPPTIPTPKKAPAPATPATKPAPAAVKPATPTTFNWPSLFTSFMGGTALGVAGAIVGKSIVTRAQEAVTGYSPYADTGGAQGEKIPQGDTAAYLKTLYNAFRGKGVTHEGAITMLAQIGRENGYQSRYLFGTHIDPKNGSMNIGMISWQGDRAIKLARFLESRGVMKNNRMIPGDAALRAQVDFMIEEMSSGSYGASLKALKDPNLKYAQIEGIIGDNYIRWARHNPLYAGSGYENQNRWMRKARAMFDQPGQQTRPDTLYTGLVDAAASLYDKITGTGTKPGEFVLPVGKARVSSQFSRSRTVMGVTRAHNGVDFAVGVGTPVRVINDGVVVKTSTGGDGGWTVGVDHGNGWYSGYSHLSGFSVRPGMRLVKGQVVGLSGGAKGHPGAGRSTGPHLHFAMSKDGRWVDPLTVLKGTGGAITDINHANAATEEGAVREPPVTIPGKPGWSLTPTKKDDPLIIQKSQIEAFAKAKKGKTPFIIQNPPAGSPSVMMTPGKGPQAPRGRSRDVSADYKRGFGL